MARYRKIDVRIWGDAWFRSLKQIPPCGAGLWFYLLTGEDTGIIPGLFRAGEAGMAEALGWPTEGFREAFGEVSREGKARADWKARLVWVPNALKHNPPASPNVIRSWREAWDELPECALKSEAWQALKSFCEGLGEGFAKAFREACPEPSRKTLANQEQEQEQEQEVAAARASVRESPQPPALRAVPAPDETPQPKHTPCLDVSGLGKLGAEWVCRLERELERGLAAATPEIRDELEQLLARPGYGGPDRALAWAVTTLDGRRRAGGPIPGSVAYVTRMLGSMPPQESGALERARQACPAWGQLLDAAMALPPGNAPSEHQLADVLLPLRASYLRGELLLEAADEGRRLFVDQVWGPGLRQLASEVLGPHVLVRVTAAGPAVAREA